MSRAALLETRDVVNGYTIQRIERLNDFVWAINTQYDMDSGGQEATNYVACINGDYRFILYNGDIPDNIFPEGMVKGPILVDPD